MTNLLAKVYVFFISTQSANKLHNLQERQKNDRASDGAVNLVLSHL